MIIPDCSIDECKSRRYSKGLCSKHYKAAWREANIERSREINRKSDTARREDGRRKQTELRALLRLVEGIDEQHKKRSNTTNKESRRTRVHSN